MEDYKPKLSDDFYINDIYVRGDTGKYILGNKKTEAHILVDINKYKIIKKMLVLLNGNNTVAEIKDKLMKENIEIDVLAIVNQLKIKGILEDSKEDIETFNEVEKFSLGISKINLNKLNSFLDKKGNVILVSYKIGFVLATLILSILLLNNNIDGLQLLSYKNSVFLGYLYLNLSMIVIFLFHEIAHCIVAVKEGLRPKFMSIVLYFYMIPIFYIKIPNLYSLKRKSMIKVLAAGILTNLLLAFVFFDIYLVNRIEIFRIIAFANLKMVYVNLLPLSLTDGYFIMSVLLKVPNIRLRQYKIIDNFFKIRKRTFNKVNKLELIYIISSIIILLIGVSGELYWILSIFNLDKMLKEIIILISLIIYMIWYVGIVKRKVSNLVGR